MTSTARPKSTDALMKQRVWDLPTRLFHWTLVVVVALAWWSAETDQQDLHLYLGYGALSLLLFRIGWGLFGSSTARFSSFVRGPSSVAKYVRARFNWPLAGHAPLGALSVLALLAMLFIMVGTGLFASDEDGLFSGPLAYLVSVDVADLLTELHEELFNVLLVLIGLHVAAILLYRLALGKNLLGPMITGKADLAPGVEPMRPGKWWVALICLVVAIAITRWIIGGAPPFGT
jgi:cytochrome b